MMVSILNNFNNKHGGMSSSDNRNFIMKIVPEDEVIECLLFLAPPRGLLSHNRNLKTLIFPELIKFLVCFCSSSFLKY